MSVIQIKSNITENIRELHSVASAMIEMQDCGIDMGIYYMADGGLRYCGLANIYTGV